MASVGEKIKKARQNSGYTQSKLAEELGVSVSTIARWEHDSSSPSVEDFGRLIDHRQPLCFHYVAFLRLL